MQNNLDRAKQFLPFDALKGFRESLEFIERQQEDIKDLDDYEKDIINIKINSLKKGDKVNIKYYYNFEYIEMIGIIKKIDFVYKSLYFLNTKIDFDDILNLDILN